MKNDEMASTVQVKSIMGKSHSIIHIINMFSGQVTISFAENGM